MVSSISSVSLPREFCLNRRIYNVPDKIKDRYMREKDRGRDRVP